MNFREKIWRKLYLHRYGLMGTVIFHLVVGIALLGIGISKLDTHTELELQVDIPTREEVQKQKEEEIRQEEKHKQNIEEEVNQMLRMAAGSVSNAQAIHRSQSRGEANVQRYIEEMTNELEQQGEGHYAMQRDKYYRQDSIQYVRDRDLQQQQLDSLKSTFYSGESSVTYSLTSRFARYMPIPVFKCEFGGKVVVSITVNRKGIVQKATIESSSQQDECLSEVAVDAALRSRFNEKPDAPVSQTGTITYIFVKQ